MSERMRGRVPRPEEVTVVLVGDCRVGKTALVTRFCEDIFIQVNLKNFFHRFISNLFITCLKTFMLRLYNIYFI